MPRPPYRRPARPGPGAQPGVHQRGTLYDEPTVAACRSLFAQGFAFDRASAAGPEAAERQPDALNERAPVVTRALRRAILGGWHGPIQRTRREPMVRAPQHCPAAAWHDVSAWALLAGADGPRGRRPAGAVTRAFSTNFDVAGHGTAARTAFPTPPTGSGRRRAGHHPGRSLSEPHLPGYRDSNRAAGLQTISLPTTTTRAARITCLHLMAAAMWCPHVSTRPTSWPRSRPRSPPKVPCSFQAAIAGRSHGEARRPCATWSSWIDDHAHLHGGPSDVEARPSVP